MAAAPFLLPDEPVRTLDDWLELGGAQGMEAADKLGPEATIEEVTASGLRGRGGGGFLTGRKWDSIRNAGGGTHYVACNAAEGEPATFKDRTLMRANPYQAVEGLAIAAWCVDADSAYICLKTSFEQERAAMTRAVQEMDAAGLLPGLTVTIVAGPEEYLFGEEKAMLEVIEGKEPLPRLFPPFQHGLFATGPSQGWEAGATSRSDNPEANPTLVNNLETLSNVPHILARGADWFRSMGTEESPGTVVCTIVGDVERPGVHEVEMGTPLSSVLRQCGGTRPGRKFRAAFSGIANAVLTPERFPTPLTYEAMAAAGSGLGAGGFVFYDDTACMVEVARAFSRVLYVESCGQCRSCKFGCGEVTRALERVEAGHGADVDIEYIGRRLQTVTDSVRCYLATEEQIIIASILREFSDEFAEHLEGRCRVPEARPITVPKIVDIVDGVVTYDEKQARKEPDWTYAGA